MKTFFLVILLFSLNHLPINECVAAPGARKAARRAAPVKPAQLIANRAQRVLVDLRGRPVRAARGREIEVSAAASRNDWLKVIYQKNLVEASWAAEMLADKRILAEVIERELGSRAKKFLPKTLGLREFLVKHQLLDARGGIRVDGDALDEVLHREFPMGFVVRPAVGVAPKETPRGLFPDTDQFIVELLKPGNPFYAPSHLTRPVRSHILGAIASGEAIVLQENIVASSALKRPLKQKRFQEVRVHTYEGKVVAGGVPDRWVQKSTLDAEDERRAEAFVGEFLMSLSLQLLSRQAWGIDVAIMDNGDMRIIDIVTNRGRQIAWSGYLDQPGVIAAYTKHFEEFYGLRFKGLSGVLIRNGFANYLPYWKKRIDMAPSGVGKVLAYLPPIP